MAGDGRQKLACRLRELKAQSRLRSEPYSKLAARADRKLGEGRAAGLIRPQAVGGWLRDGTPADRVEHLLALVRVLQQAAGPNVAVSREAEWVELWRQAKETPSPRRQQNIRRSRAESENLSTSGSMSVSVESGSPLETARGGSPELDVAMWISNVEIHDSNVFATKPIKLDKYNAIVGVHGSGKSLLLELLYRKFGGGRHCSTAPLLAGDEHVFDATAAYAHYDVTVAIGEGSTNNNSSYIPKGFHPIYLSTGQMFADMHYQLQNSGPLEENEIDCDDDYSFSLAYEYDDAGLDALERVLYRTYRSVKVYLNNYGFLHVVAQTAEGRTIDSSMMSFGEFWVHWVLGWDGVHLDDPSPRLIDEPESFLASRGHKAFIEELFYRSSRRGSQLIVSTHSPDILARFPLSHIRLCTQTPNGVQVDQPRDVGHIRRDLDLKHPLRAVVLVEDDLARCVLEAILTKFDDRLLQEVEVAAVSVRSDTQSRTREICPDSEQISCAANMSRNIVVDGLRALTAVQRVRHMGVLDGNARSYIDTMSIGVPVCFMPGTRKCFQELAHVAEIHADAIGEDVGISESEVLGASTRYAASERSDWILKFGKQLGFSGIENPLTRALVRIWVGSVGVHDEARTMVNEIRSILDCFD